MLRLLFRVAENDELPIMLPKKSSGCVAESLWISFEKQKIRVGYIKRAIKVESEHINWLRSTDLMKEIQNENCAIAILKKKPDEW